MIPRQTPISTCYLSAFLFGPRQTGKTFLLKNNFVPDIFINFLKKSDYLRYIKDFSLLTKEIEALKKDNPLIVVDEIQRIPELLNEIHAIIEDMPGVQFILTGSSARKLRKGGVNLLGGRALTFHLHPLTHIEIGKDFKLDQALSFGTLPKIWLENNLTQKRRLLKSYVETYLKEEIQQEALVRNIPAFANFLELSGFENGHIINFSKLSQQIGIHSKTVKEYFQILEDTLVAFLLYPYKKSHRTRLISSPKFYFFDTGIVQSLQKRLSSPLIYGTQPYGDAFEHWIILETKRLIDYYELECNFYFFNTTDGTEVDLILEFADQTWAVEIKSSSNPGNAQLRGLKSFLKDHSINKAFCVCQTPRTYNEGPIQFIPWQDFFELLNKMAKA